MFSTLQNTAGVSPVPLNILTTCTDPLREGKSWYLVPECGHRQGWVPGASPTSPGAPTPKCSAPSCGADAAVGFLIIPSQGPAFPFAPCPHSGGSPERGRAAPHRRRQAHSLGAVQLRAKLETAAVSSPAGPLLSVSSHPTDRVTLNFQNWSRGASISLQRNSNSILLQGWTVAFLPMSVSFGRCRARKSFVSRVIHENTNALGITFWPRLTKAECPGGAQEEDKRCEQMSGVLGEQGPAGEWGTPSLYRLGGSHLPQAHRRLPSPSCSAEARTSKEPSPCFSCRLLSRVTHKFCNLCAPRAPDQV